MNWRLQRVGRSVGAHGARSARLSLVVPQHPGGDSGEKQKLNYIADKALWAAALAFHWAMFIIILRHFRFFIEPVPAWVGMLQSVDGFFQVGLPVYYGSTFLMVVGLTYLLARRFFDAKIRYISLPTDYFAPPPPPPPPPVPPAWDRPNGHPHASCREGRCGAGQSGDRRVGIIPAGRLRSESVCGTSPTLFSSARCSSISHFRSFCTHRAFS